MNPERVDVDMLNDHLDAIVRGAVSPSLNGNASLADLVGRFFAADDAPPPPPGLAEQIWEDLMSQHATAVLTPGVSIAPAARPALAPPRGAPGKTTWRGAPALAYFATAALIALTLLAGFAAFRGDSHPTEPDSRHFVVPALDATPERAASPAAVTDEIMFQATIETLGQMPESRAQHEMSLSRWRLEPGAVQPVGEQENTGVGIVMFLVESGQVTVEADAPIEVTRAGATATDATTPVAAGTEVVLETGDELYAPPGAGFRRRNDGDTQAVLLELTLGSVGDIAKDRQLPAGVNWDAGLPWKLVDEFPAVPAEAIVTRLVLAPGAERAVRDMPGLELVHVEAGSLDLIFDRESLSTPERFRTLDAGNGTDVFGRTPERAVLANRGTEPLQLLVVSILPPGSTEATPAP